MHTLFDFITMTKGTEYLIAAAFLLVFVVFFWRYATASAAPSAARARQRIGETARSVGDLIGGFLLPEGVFFHPGHTWARVEQGDILSVGIDDFGQKLVGKIDAVETPGIGARLSQGERVWTLRVDGNAIDMLSPVDGEVVAINTHAVNSPEILHKDPFGQGWLLKVLDARRSANLKGLLSGTLAKNWIEEARAKLMAGSDHALGPVLADAGPPRQGIARALNREQWVEITRAFFLTGEE